MARSALFSAQTLKRFTSVHSWIGIFAGSILFIAFFAGALTMYEAPIHQWANPDLRPSGGTAPQLNRLVATLGDERAAGGNFTILLDGPGPVASYYQEDGHRHVAHTRVIDAGGGIVRRSTASDVDRLIDELHFTAGIPGTTGYILLGIVSAVYFLALITGVIIQLPHLLADLFALRVGKNLKKMWMDAHNAIGIMSLPFHLMFAITGFLLSVLFMLPGVYVHVTPTPAPIQAYEVEGGHGDRDGRGAGAATAAARMLPPAQLVARASARLTHFTPRSISYANYGRVDAVATVEGRLAGALTSAASVNLSAVTGGIVSVDAPGTRSTARNIANGYTALHYGDFASELMRFLYFVLGLGGAFLFYSGNLLWVETKRKRRHVAQARSGWMVAQMTIGLCLGSCLGIAAALLGSRLLPPHLIAGGAERDIYYLGFFGALIWSFARPPVRAATEILTFAAITYATLPIVNAATSPDNIIISLLAARWDVATVDLMTTALAAGFTAAAWATHRRSRTGQPNSVWGPDATIEPRPPISRT